MALSHAARPLPAYRSTFLSHLARLSLGRRQLRAWTSAASWNTLVRTATSSMWGSSSGGTPQHWLPNTKFRPTVLRSFRSSMSTTCRAVLLVSNTLCTGSACLALPPYVFAKETGGVRVQNVRQQTIGRAGCKGAAIKRGLAVPAATNERERVRVIT